MLFTKSSFICGMSLSVLLTLQILIITSCFVVSAEGIRWSQCGVKGERIQVKNLVTTPAHVVRGEKLTLTLKLGNEHEITNGAGHLKIWLWVVVVWYDVYDRVIPLSKLFSDQFPIKRYGTVDFTHSIPSSAPSGEYRVKFWLSDQDKRAACVEFWFNI